MRATALGVSLVGLSLVASGCVVSVVEAEPVHEVISVVAPRCAGVSSCLLGHVTTAGTAAPIAEAAVFLERELAPGEDEPVRIISLTDEQGVFVVDEPPPGSYRIAVYKNDSSVELTGMELGHAGTTMLPVRLTTE